MAPLTRRRAQQDGSPTKLNATYYQQRAGAGLIIAEATQISAFAKGYPDTPAIYTKKQTNAWQRVCEAVHEKGGKIFLQLWHVGRYSHPDLLPKNMHPQAPSAIKMNASINVGNTYKDSVIPKELSIIEIKKIISDFQFAAENAFRAGFDGIEIHGANGYLIDQFLQDGTNIRKDIYGGSIENRSRFLFEIIEAIAEVWNSQRIGLRLSPSGTKMEMSDSNSKKHFTYVINELNKYNLAYLHLLEPWHDVSKLKGYATDVAEFYRPIYKGTLIASGGFSLQSANDAILNKTADLVAFGKAFISNPDLVKRFELNAPLNEWETDTFYGGDEKGYTDYPFLKLQI
jgi:N-ethylmaleimide reductase